VRFFVGAEPEELLAVRESSGELTEMLGPLSGRSNKDDGAQVLLAEDGSEEALMLELGVAPELLQDGIVAAFNARAHHLEVVAHARVEGAVAQRKSTVGDKEPWPVPSVLLEGSNFAPERPLGLDCFEDEFR